jgi:hypothetical protein
MTHPHSSPPPLDADTGPEAATATMSANATPEMATVVITADHVYLPLDENGDGTFDWAVSNVSTTKVARRTRLKVPVDLACFLSDRDQAEIV